MDERFEKCIDIVREAGDRLTEVRDIRIEEKSGYSDIVTQYDKLTQAFLIERLAQIYPTATFLGEEDGVADLGGEYLFVIDPIDGTTNFAKNYGYSAISVGCADREGLFFGIIYNPFLQDMYTAYRGEGACKNGRPIHASRTDLKHSLVCLGTSPYYPELRNRSFVLAERLMDAAMDIRRSGSAALDLCSVAEGRNGVFFECLLSPWDFAAGKLIVQEAGGILTTLEGTPAAHTKKQSILAAGPRAHEDFLAFLEKQKDI